MVSEPNANKQVQKKIQLRLQCLEGLPFICGQFSAMITLKMWQSTLPDRGIVGAVAEIWQTPLLGET